MESIIKSLQASASSVRNLTAIDDRGIDEKETYSESYFRTLGLTSCIRCNKKT